MSRFGFKTIETNTKEKFFLTLLLDVQNISLQNEMQTVVETTLVAFYLFLFFSTHARQSTASAIPGTSDRHEEKDTARKRDTRREIMTAHDWRAQIFKPRYGHTGWNCLWVI